MSSSNFIIVSFTRNDCGFHCERRRKNISAVIIGVLADKVDAACAGVEMTSLTEQFIELALNLLFHCYELLVCLKSSGERHKVLHAQGLGPEVEHFVARVHIFAQKRF